MTLTVVAALWLVSRLLKGGGQRVDGGKARQLVESGAKLIDVRTAAEFQRHHLPGARNIPHQELSGRLAEVGEKSVPVVLYCQSGARSGMAARALQRAGYAQVYNLGPIAAW
jgi:phage shock protein E